MGNEVAQWRAAIGGYYFSFASHHASRQKKRSSNTSYPYRPPDDHDPADIKKALNQHFRFALVAATILPHAADRKKEFFNGLVLRLMLLEAGIEQNPGPACAPGDSTNKPPAKRLKTLDAYFRAPVPDVIPCGGGSSTTGTVKPVTDMVVVTVSPELPIAVEEGGSGDGAHPPSPCSASAESAVPQSLSHESSSSESETISGMPDIGDFIGLRQGISDSQKVQLLENHWKPPLDYDFPYSKDIKSGKEFKRYLKQSHLDKFTWLVLSHKSHGLYCKYCPLFAVGHVGGGQKTVPLQKLVTVPLKNFKDLLGKHGDLEKHENNAYHKAAVETGKKFIKTYHKPESDVLNQVNQQRLAQVKENRERLVPIVLAMLFLGRQGLALRGHRDDGALLLNPCSGGQENEQQKNPVVDDSVSRNEGNFREVLRLMVDSGDDKLKSHLETASSRATYISKTSQNELIECIGQEILEVILRRIQKAVLYTVMFDETSDVSHTSQLSLVIRYVTPNFQVYEDFIGFVDTYGDLEKAQDDDSTYSADEDDCDAAARKAAKKGELKLTGKAIAEIVLRILRKLGLSLKRCVGIGTDGCSVMLSDIKGAVKEIQKECTNAVRTPCYNHKLNLSLSKSSSIPCVRNAIGTIKECINFFDSPKRNQVLSRIVGHKLSGLCETRWIERHDGVLQFSTDLPKILKALDEISEWEDTSTSSKAVNLCAALTDTSFLVSVVCLSDLLALTLPLSKLLQKKSLTLDAAAQDVSNLLVVLDRRRGASDIYFGDNIWQQAVELAKVIDVEFKMPRRCSRQGHRANYASSSTDEYFRLSIYNPLLDHVMADLRERFPPEVLDVFGLPLLLPRNLLEKSDENLEQIAQKLVKQFAEINDADPKTALLSLKGELYLWREKWRNVEFTDLPLITSEVMKACDPDVYPLIYDLLKLLTTLPISNASAERSFSALRRLKDWMRSTMGENRLNGLALRLCHRDIKVSIDQVITRFAKCRSRRIEFVM